jgi:TM2 domain-containing membrane protein YozV
MTEFTYEQCTPAFLNNDTFAQSPEGKSRGLTALCAIFLCWLGAQYFYLGKPIAGVLTIIATVVTVGFFDILLVIQGIQMLRMDNETFRKKYVTTTSGFPLF